MALNVCVLKTLENSSMLDHCLPQMHDIVT